MTDPSASQDTTPTQLDDLDSGMAEVRTGDAGQIQEDEAGDARPAATDEKTAADETDEED